MSDAPPYVLLPPLYRQNRAEGHILHQNCTEFSAPGYDFRVNWREDPAKVRPMLATPAAPPLTGAGLVFEPKYDGIRALVHVAPRRGGADIRLWSRLGNEKTSQFPSVVQALEAWAQKLKAPVLLDGELVALDANGRPAGFQKLQGRIHLSDAREVERIEHQQPVALIVFDILRDGDEDVRGLALTDRRARLEQRLTPNPTLRLCLQAPASTRKSWRECGSCSRRGRSANRHSPNGSRPTSRRTGSSLSWWPRSASPSGRPTESCGIRFTSGCETTNAPRMWSWRFLRRMRHRTRIVPRPTTPW
jgi:hypothetical protein